MRLGSVDTVRTGAVVLSAVMLVVAGFSGAVGTATAEVVDTSTTTAEAAGTSTTTAEAAGTSTTTAEAAGTGTTVSAYHFDETSTDVPVTDYRGSNDGQFDKEGGSGGITGGNPIYPGTGVPGVVRNEGDWGNGLAFDFDNSSDGDGDTNGDEGVTVPIDLQGSTGFTAAAWINASSESANGGVLFSQQLNANAGWRFWIDDGNDHLKAEIDNGNGEVTVDTGRNLSDLTWHHVAMTYDGSTLAVYINGSLVASASQSGEVSTTLSKTFIGKADADGANTEYDGRMDEPLIANRTFDSGEITTLFETNGIEADLSVSASTDPTASYEAGEQVTWAYDVTNDEPYSLSGVSVSESVTEGASGLTNVEYSTDGGTTWTTGTTATIDLSGSETKTITFRGTVGDSASGSLSPSLTATPPATYTDPTTGDRTASVGVDLLAAPTLSSGDSLPAIDEDVADSNNGGETIGNLLSDEFSDADGNSFTGVAIDGDASTASEGTWQYSTDGGSTWYDVGSVSDTSALLVDTSTAVRFVPETNYNGSPGSLTVHAVDDGASTTFTSGSTRQTFDTTADGTASEVAENGDSVSITVNAVNDPPTLDDQSITTDEDTDETLDLSAKASDVDGDSLSFTVTSAPSHGTATISSGTLTYDPDADYNGGDSLTVEVSDGNGGTDTATVSVTVNAVTDPPSLSDQSITTDEDTDATLDLSAKASDPDGDSLSFTVTSAPSDGTATISSGTLTYDPDANYNGGDSLTVEVSDGNGGTDTATVSITVNAVNDAPTLSDQSLTTERDTDVTLDLSAKASDVEGDSLSFTVTSAPSDGTATISSGTLTYDPDTGFTGSDSLTVEVSDGNGGTDTATVSITVSEVAPTADAGSDQSTVSGADVTLDGSGSTDPNDAIVAYRWDFNSDGEVDATGKTVTHQFYVTGDRTVTLTVVDEAGNTDTDTATVTVGNTNGWPTYGRNPVHLAHWPNATVPSTPLGPKWTRSFGEYSYVDPPVTAGDLLYVTGWDEPLHAIYPENGTSAWRFTPPTASSWEDGFSVRPTIADGTVYAVSADHYLYALDAETGTEQWRYELDSYVRDSPVVSDGTVFVTTPRGTMYAIDAATGTADWTFETESRPSSRYRYGITTSAAVVDDTVYFGTDNGTLYAADAGSGSIDWAASLGSDSDSYVFLDELTVAENTIFTALESEVYAVNASDGATRWRYNATEADDDWLDYIFGGGAYADGRYFVGDSDGDFMALDATDGSEEWKVSLDGRWNSFSGAPLVVDGTVLTLDREYTLHAFDATTGTEQWSYTAGERVYDSPLVANGTVYLAGSKLLALHTQDLAPNANAGSNIKTPEDAAVEFDGSKSSDDVGIDSYAWDFGDGTSATGKTPTHAYSESGEYTATLTVTDTAGQTSNDSVSVTVTDNSVLVANGGPNQTADEDTSVTFDASDSRSSEGIDTYEWDFDGDGVVDATGESVSHTFAQPGTYSVTLTLTDADGNTATDVVTTTIADTTPPTAAAGSDRTVDEDTTVTLDASGSSDNDVIEDYRWDVDDKETKSGETVSYRFENPGEYSVTLRVTDGGANVATDQVNVTVRDTTPPAAKASSTVLDATSGKVEFDASDSVDNDAIASYAWDFTSDGTTDATGMTATHTFSDSGTYTTTLTVTDEAGNTATDTTTVTIEGSAVLSADAGGNRSVNEGESVAFDASGTRSSEGGVSYDWDFDADGTTDATGKTASTSFSTVGTQKVVLTVTDADGNTATDSVWVTVADVTDPTADAGSDVTVDEDTAFDLDGTGSTDNVGVTSYEWDYRNDGTTDATGAKPTASFATPGTYEIAVTVTDDAGNTDTDTLTVTIADATPPSISGYAVSNPFDTSVKVSFQSTEQLDQLTASIGGAESATLTLSDFSRSSLSTGYRYTATYDASSTGDYTVTLDTAQDAAGNDGAGSESGTISIDTTPPTIVDAVSATNPSGQDVRVSFGTDEQLSYISLSIGRAESATLSTADFTETANGDGTYTYTATYSGSTDGTYTISLTDADDSAGNDGGSGQSDSVSIDTAAPSISSFGVTNPADQDLTVSFDSSEQLATISVSIGGAGSATLSTADFSETANVDGTYTYEASYSGSTDGTYTATLDTAEDSDANDGASGQSDSVTVDTTAPTVSAFAAINPSATDVRVSFDASEQLATISVSIGGAESGSLATGDFTETANGDGTYTYTATYSGSTDGTYTATLETAADGAGNDGAASESDSVDTDSVVPDVSQFRLSNPASQEVRVSFDSTEQLASITVSIGGAESGTLSTAAFTETDNGDGTYTYEATYSGSTDGTYTATLDTAEDSDGNDGASGESDSVTVDSTAPTVSAFAVSNPSGQDVRVSFDSTEQLGTISASIGGAESGTLTASDFAETDNGDGTFTYTATYSGSTDGTYTATLDTAEDDAANDGASNQAASVTVDTTAPTVSAFAVSNPSGQNVRVTFDSDEQLTTVTASIGGAESGTLSTAAFIETDNGDGTFTYTATYSGSNDGTYTATLDTAEDSDANDGASGESASVTVDSTAPTVSAFTASNPSAQDVRVSFDTTEQLATVSASIEGAESATLSTADFTETDNGDGTYTYTATYSGSTDGTYTATLDTAEDSDGNDGASGESASVTVDTTAPTISAVAVSNPSAQAVQVTFDSDERLATISASIGGAESATLSTGDFTEVEGGDGTYSYTATYSGSTDGTYTVTLDTAEDAAANDGASGQSDSVIVDTTAPTVSAFAVGNPSGQDVSVSFDSTEQLSTISVSIRGAESGTLSTGEFTETANGDGTYSYTATYSGSSDGTYTAALGTAEDSDGNDGAGSQSASVTVDVTPPAADAGDDRTVDEDTPITFDGSNSTDAVGIASYTWDFDDGTTASGASTLHTFAEPGTYQVQLDATDAAGNTGTDTSTVTVRDVTPPTVDAGTNLTASEGATVEFSDNGSTDNVGIERYEWDFGDGTTASGADVSHTFSRDGQFEVRLDATDAAGNTGSDTLTVFVKDTSVLVADAGPNLSTTAGQSVTLSANGSSASEGVDTYEWTFPDGTTDSGETVTRSFSTPGRYEVELTVTDTEGNTATNTVTVTVRDETAPTAASGGDRATTVDQSLDFDGTSSTDNVGVTGYVWDFGDGTTATGATPAHTYEETGIYTVRMTVTDAAGNTATDTATVTVTDVGAPTITSFDASSPSGRDVDVRFESSERLTTVSVSITGPETATLTRNDFSEQANGDGTYTYEATYTASTDGTYTATLDTAADGSGNDGSGGQSASTTVDTSPPTAEAGPDVTTGVGESVQFDAVGTVDNTRIRTFEWDVDGDGTVEITTGSQATTHTYDQPGTYTVTLTVTDAGGNTDTDTLTVTVTADDGTAPTADAGTNRTVEVGAPVTLDGSGSSDDEGIASYEWDVDGDGTVEATGPTPNVTYDAAGTYTVRLTVTDDAGNTDTDTVMVTVTADDGTAPTAEAGSNRTVEVGQSITLNGSASSDDGEIASYEWDVGDDGTVDATGATAGYTFDTVGSYTVALTVTDDAGNTDTDTVTITVEDTVPPTADAGDNQTVTVGQPVSLDGTGSTDDGTIVSYEWDVDDDGSAEVTGATANHSYRSPGTYRVTLTVTDTFGNTDTDTVTITVEAATEPSVTVADQTYRNGTDRITVESYQFGDAGGSLTVWTTRNGSLTTRIGEALTAPAAGTDVTVNLTTTLTANTTIAATIHQNAAPSTANAITNDTATVTIVDAAAPATGSVTVANQTVANGTSNLTVASAQATVNYTVSLHRNSPTGPTVATSATFDAGTTQRGLNLSLSQPLTANATLYAVVEAADSGDALANASAAITVESDDAPDDPVEDYDRDDNDNIEIDELGAAAADFAQGDISIADLAAVATRFASGSS